MGSEGEGPTDSRACHDVTVGLVTLCRPRNRVAWSGSSGFTSNVSTQYPMGHWRTSPGRLSCGCPGSERTIQVSGTPNGWDFATWFGFPWSSPVFPDPPGPDTMEPPLRPDAKAECEDLELDGHIVCLPACVQTQ
eukprot:gene18597-biopygen15988